LFEVKIPNAVTVEKESEQTVDENAPDFVKNITYKMMIGKGDDLPVPFLLMERIQTELQNGKNVIFLKK
jgi:pyruvate-ferredoxin/flavodoxin oxidoreductase